MQRLALNVTRRWKRYPGEWSLQVLIPSALGDERVLGQAHDLNQGGMALKLPKELKIGARVKLNLTFAGFIQPLTLLAMVRNRVGSTHGMQFINPSRQQQEMIAAKFART